MYPLHGVTEATRRHKGAWPPSGNAGLARPARLRILTFSAGQATAQFPNQSDIEIPERRGLHDSSCFGEGALRKVPNEYGTHYDQDHPHQGKNKELRLPRARKNGRGTNPLFSRKRLGGLLKFYFCEAACFFNYMRLFTKNL